MIEPAYAKVNLTLRVIRRRTDGYHDLDSLVVFARVADRLSFVPGRTLELTVRGPTAAAAGNLDDNLVRKAAVALAARVEGLTLGAFALDKRLPVAAGLGGGSADAGAALRLLARANRLAADDPRLHEAARATGADVPVCLDPRARRMQGVGDVLSAPLDFPGLPAVLVNPRVSVPTKQVFVMLRLGDASIEPHTLPVGADRTTLIAALAAESNDLEAAAVAIEPAIADVLAALRAAPACRLARMSGSGATCFGLFDSLKTAEAAATSLRKAKPAWWVRATVLNGYR